MFFTPIRLASCLLVAASMNASPQDDPLRHYKIAETFPKKATKLSLSPNISYFSLRHCGGWATPRANCGISEPRMSHSKRLQVLRPMTRHSPLIAPWPACKQGISALQKCSRRNPWQLIPTMRGQNGLSAESSFNRETMPGPGPFSKQR